MHSVAESEWQIHYENVVDHDNSGQQGFCGDFNFLPDSDTILVQFYQKYCKEF